MGMIIITAIITTTQGDSGRPGAAGTKGQKGEKAGVGLPGRRVSIESTFST